MITLRVFALLVLVPALWLHGDEAAPYTFASRPGAAKPTVRVGAVRVLAERAPLAPADADRVFAAELARSGGFTSAEVEAPADLLVHAMLSACRESPTGTAVQLELVLIRPTDLAVVARVVGTGHGAASEAALRSATDDALERALDAVHGTALAAIDARMGDPELHAYRARGAPAHLRSVVMLGAKSLAPSPSSDLLAEIFATELARSRAFALQDRLHMGEAMGELRLAGDAADPRAPDLFARLTLLDLGESRIVLADDGPLGKAGTALRKCHAKIALELIDANTQEIVAMSQKSAPVACAEGAPLAPITVERALRFAIDHALDDAIDQLARRDGGGSGSGSAAPR